MSGKDALAGAARGAVYSVGLQLSLKVTSFLLNAFILRFISRELLGIASVRLWLLYSTVVFLTSEGFRRACLSQIQKQRNWQQVINLLWLPLPLSVAWACLLSWVWLWWLERPDPDKVPNYSSGVLCYTLAAVIEMLCEPLLVFGQLFLFTRLKVVNIGVTELIKSIMVMALAVWCPSLGTLTFAIPQVIGAVVYVLLYWIFFAIYLKSPDRSGDDIPFQDISQILPHPVAEKPWINKDLTGLVWSFLKQSYIKHILTEGEKIVMTFFGVLSFGDQGVYDVINNLGSMAPRILFLPVEENSYLFYTHTLIRGQPLEKQDSKAVKEVAGVLSSVLKCVTLIGVTVLVFGYSFAFLALDIYGGSILSSGAGPVLLRWYCLYVLIIAVNGTTEGFMFAAMSKDEVERYNKKMVMFSVVFLFFSWLLTRSLGSVGLILANCLNMSLRIAHSIHFIWNYFSGTSLHPLREIVPSKPVLLTLVASLIIASFTEYSFCSRRVHLGCIVHIFGGALCFIAVVASVYFSENNLVNFIKEQYQSRRKKKE